MVRSKLQVVTSSPSASSNQLDIHKDRACIVVTELIKTCSWFTVCRRRVAGIVMPSVMVRNHPGIDTVAGIF